MLTLAKREPSALLLAAQVAAVLAYPFMVDNKVGLSLISVFGIAILGLVVLAVRFTPALTWVTILLGIPATVLLVIQAVTQSDKLLQYSSGFEALLYFYAAGAMIAYMLADHEVTRDELFAVGATFTPRQEAGRGITCPGPLALEAMAPCTTWRLAWWPHQWCSRGSCRR